MAYTQADLDAVRKARASGVRSVRQGDQEVTYKSDQEMAAAEKAILDELARTDVTTPIRRRVYLRQVGRGY